MADFFFFTDPQLMTTQDAAEAFGVIDTDNYRIDSMHSATSTPKAYAVTAGQILVQEVVDNADLVNVVLKPNNQPDLNLPTVEYIIYKGVLKSSLVEGAKVAAATSNDFTKQIHTDLAAYYENSVKAPVPAELPYSGDVLGLYYRADATDQSFLAEDDTPLSKAFYNSEIEGSPLQTVKAGAHLGNFSSAKFGILVSFEKVGYTPTFKLARELETKITVDATTEESTAAVKFNVKHKKEEVHNFIDPAAFFGTFTQLGLNSGGTKKGDDLYSTVVSKFANSNKVYLDLRNEYDDSYNYYENYGNFVYWNLEGTEEYTQKDYYGDNQWPVLSIDNTELAEGKTLKLGFPKGDNDFPTIFLKSGYLENLGVSELPKDYESYLGGAIDENSVVSFDDKLKFPTVSTGQVYSNYFQLKYIKRYTTSESQLLGLSLKKESYLDNLFPIFDMQIPFSNTKADISVKTFHENVYIDKSNINESEFYANAGIAIDNESVNFIAYPLHYNSAETETTEVLPLAGKESFEGNSFLDDFNKNFSNYGIQKQNFATKDTNIEYLTLNTGVGQAVIADDGEVSVEQEISVKQASIGKTYDYDNINILSLTKEEMEQLAALKEAQFTAPYKVYLGIGNVNDLSVDENGYSSINLVLRGLKEEDGIIATKEVSTTVQLFAEDSIYNWDENSVVNERVIDAIWVDKDLNKTTLLPYGDNTARVLIKTENILGNTLEISVMQNGALFPRLTNSVTVSSNETIFSFDFTSEVFGTEANIGQFYIRTRIGTSRTAIGTNRSFANAGNDYLRVHAVRYVPEVMQNLGWLNAKKTQDYWFSNAANSNARSVNPELNFVSFDWLLGFERANEEYQQIISTLWKTENAKDSLRDEIQRMISNGLINMPTAANEVEFGELSFSVDDLIEKVIDGRNEIMPKIEDYYYTSLSHQIDKIPIADGDGIEPRDDLFGTLGSYNWRVAASGTLTYVNDIELKVTIESLTIYVKDSFDFDERADEYLGDWDFKDNELTINALALFDEGVKVPLPGNIAIHNSDYRAFRNDHNKGGNYHIYSTLRTVNITTDNQFNIILL